MTGWLPVVEKGIPRPTKKAPGPRSSIYDGIEVDDSFFTDRWGRVTGFHNYCKRRGFKMTRVACTENGVPGWRVWRIE